MNKEQQILFQTLSKKDKGILIISNNINDKDLYLNFLSEDLTTKWSLTLNNEDYGYIDTYTDSKELIVAFTSDYIYFLHLYNTPIVTRGVAYIVQIDYEGKVKKKSFKLEKEMKWVNTFINNDKICLLFSDKYKLNEPKQHFYHEVSSDDLSLSEKKIIAFPKEINEWNITSIYGGKIYLFGYENRNNANQDAQAFLYAADLTGKIFLSKTMSIQVPSGYTICPDYGVGSSATYVITSDDETHLFIDEKNTYYYIYGMFASSKNYNKPEKTGFYIKKYNMQGAIIFDKNYFFTDLTQLNPAINEMNKKENYISFFTLNPQNQNILYGIRQYKNYKSKPNTTTCMFELQNDGVIIQSFFSTANWITSYNINTFHVSTIDSDSDYRLSTYYTSNTQNAQKELLQITSKYINETDKPSFNLFFMNTNDIIVEFWENNDKVILHKVAH